jgi:hypothetical protein
METSPPNTSVIGAALAQANDPETVELLTPMTLKADTAIRVRQRFSVHSNYTIDDNC